MEEKKPFLRCVYSREQIQTRVRELSGEINALYAGKSLVVVCVLKGAFMFFADLLKELTVEPQVDFVRLASYGSGRESTRSISFTKDVELSLQGKHVLIVEDVIDSGHTMEFLLHQFEARGAVSLRIAVCIDKSERREVVITPDFVGFSLSQGFIVGYGLDCAEKYRELPAIYELLPE